MTLMTTGNGGSTIMTGAGDGGMVSVSSGSSGDKNYVMSFTNTSVVSVDHNLGKYPAVTVVDSAGDQVSASPKYTSVNQVVLTFINPFSGKVYCN
ncbi:MAG: hypothetical protein WA991_04000 [Ornithinimicrobium sp.]